MQAMCLDASVVYWRVLQHLVVQVEGQVVAQQQVEQRLLPQAVVPQRRGAVQRQQLAAGQDTDSELIMTKSTVMKEPGHDAP